MRDACREKEAGPARHAPVRAAGVPPAGQTLQKVRETGHALPEPHPGDHPELPRHVWAADFTHLWYRGKVFYLATTLDLFTPKIVGWSLQTTHGASLVLQALFVALLHHPRPRIFHSDNGRENGSTALAHVLEDLGVAVSCSRPACPWENGYQESFYSGFKVDLGDPSRFKTLGEFVYAVYQAIHAYNRSRIHSALKMPPAIFAQLAQTAPARVLEKVSDVWGS